MKPTHEHEFEAQLGLPEKLPKGEFIVWQGTPDWWALGVDAFHLKSLGLYFVLMLVLQASYLSEQGGDWSMKPMLMTFSLIVLTLGSLAAWAYMSAKASMYTITNKRVVMRIGIVFSVTFNLPLQQIVSAQELHKRGSSDISLKLKGSDRIAWLHLWPHARPWVLNQPEPTLRCLKDGQVCAEHLKSAWTKLNGVKSSEEELMQITATPNINSDNYSDHNSDHNSDNNSNIHANSHSHHQSLPKTSPVLVQKAPETACA